jgi:ribosome biogenesis GTPase / thiamine phosphate phosphatase
LENIFLGWNERLNEAFRPYGQQGFTPGRIALEHKQMYNVITEQGDYLAEVSGKLRHEAQGRDAFPAVGDWVALRAREDEGRATIHTVLPRWSKFSRMASGNEKVEQIVAANVDTVFLVNALNQDFNLRRMERYLTLAWESGAAPVIVLSKSDLCDAVEERILETQHIALGVPIHAVSTEMETGLEALQSYLSPGQTVALLGSSGVGKSTLVNRLAGKQLLKTGDIREDDGRGKHTTTHRELVQLSTGAFLIDTPGMRELQLWDSSEGLTSAFEDVEGLSQACYYQDCSHDSEPGCAVKRAITEGTLSYERFQSYLKLSKELAYLARKDDKSLQAAEKQKWKKIHQAMKQHKIRH